MAIDERTKRALAVHRQLKEMTMGEAHNFTKHRRVPDHGHVLREFRDGTAGEMGIGPEMVSVQFEGKHMPSLLVSEKKLAETAKQFGGDEKQAALALVTELHASQHLPEEAAIQGLHVGGKLHLSARGHQALAEDLARSGLGGVDPEQVGEAMNAVLGGSNEDDAIAIGPGGGWYRVAEHEHGARGRSVLGHLSEDIKTGANGERAPRNVVRTLVVRTSNEPTDEEHDEEHAFDSILRRHPQRKPAKGES